jgi:hypothetical protein
MRFSEHGTICRSTPVENTTDSSCSVRRVATFVPMGMPTDAMAGAASQNVTSAWAGVAGIRRNPMSSRNFT